MTIRDLRIFVAVAEEKTMHGAARRLYVSQPSISQAISDLEKEYGILLFERLNKRLYITETGTRLLPYAQHLIASFDDVEQLFLGQGASSHLRIGASVSVGTCMISDYVTQLKSTCPDIEVSVVINNTSEIEGMIMDSTLDVGVVEGEILHTDDLVCNTVCDDELLVVAAPSHPLCSFSEITAEQLNHQDFIAREAGSSDRNQFEQFLSQHDISINKAWISSSPQAIVNAVVAGNGLAILSHMLVDEEIKTGRLVVLPVKDVHIMRQIKLIYHRNKYISKDLQQFLNITEPDT